VRDLLADEVPAEVLDTRLLEVERANLELYGYGAKAYTLSLIETAIELAGSRLSIGDVQALLDAGKDLLAHPIELLPGAREAVEAAKAAGLVVLLVTKGDLFHQESKVARSGFGDLVDHVEVVAEKDIATYGRVLARHQIDPASFLMVGNSLRSDCAPVLSLGGRAAFVPHPLTWALEHPDDEERIRAATGFTELASLAELGPWLRQGPH
jgi:putative hydrolase of the HAD superfamily